MGYTDMHSSLVFIVMALDKVLGLVGGLIYRQVIPAWLELSFFSRDR